MGLIKIFKPLSTFLQAMPLINLSNMDDFDFWKKLWDCWESNSEQLGLEANMPTIVKLPPHLQWFVWIKTFRAFYFAQTSRNMAEG